MGVFTLKITDNSSKVGAELEEAVKKALTLCGTEAQSYAKKYLTEKGAVDTGNLRNSVAYKVEDQTMAVGTNVEYAPYIEYGTYKMAARPYLEPAIADNADKYRSIIRSTLGG